MLLLTVWNVFFHWILVPSLPLITTLFLCSPLACKGEFDVSSTRTILLMGDLLYEMRLHEFFLEYFAHWICWARILFIHLFSQDWYWNGLDYIYIHVLQFFFLPRFIHIILRSDWRWYYNFAWYIDISLMGHSFILHSLKI